MSKHKEIDRRTADKNHDVVTMSSMHDSSKKICHRKTPCKTCPWLLSSEIGNFPAEAFRISAETGHDMSRHVFGCHTSGTSRPKICAGFLLRGASHNLAIRLAYIRNELGPLSEGGKDLYANYVEMAVANGVPRDDESLRDVRQDQY